MRASALVAAVTLLVGCSGPASTTVLTGPEGQRWDAQNLVGHCVEQSSGDGGAYVDNVSCDVRNAKEVLNVVNESADCDSRTQYIHVWPAQGPDPNVVLCLR